MLAELFNQLLAQSGWEALAVALGIAYVILAARESVWCWPAAFISTGIYTVLFWSAMLPMQSLLNFYYLAMAIYGFTLWHKTPTPTQNIIIHRWSAKQHSLLIGFGIILTVLLGILLKSTQTGLFPYLDAFVMVFSMLTTFLMARKVIENWLYWMVINSAAIHLYWQTEFYLTAVMFGLYFILAVFGWINWRKKELAEC
jgi:nicotinamide mononucleotide transporter